MRNANSYVVYPSSAEYVTGSRRQVPHLWAYLLIGQVLPISFAQSLFLVAMILYPTPDLNSIMQVPSLLSQCIPLAAYYIFVFSAPSTVDKPSFISVVVAIRLLLLCPFIFRLQVSHTFGSKAIPTQNIHSGYSASYNMGLLCSLVLFLQQTYVALMGNGFGTVVAAINSNPAVSTLGYDSIFYVVLSLAWSTFNPKLIAIST